MVSQGLRELQEVSPWNITTPPSSCEEEEPWNVTGIALFEY